MSSKPQEEKVGSKAAELLEGDAQASGVAGMMSSKIVVMSTCSRAEQPPPLPGKAFLRL